jgi:hypothetical protein
MMADILSRAITPYGKVFKIVLELVEKRILKSFARIRKIRVANTCSHDIFLLFVVHFTLDGISDIVFYSVI